MQEVPNNLNFTRLEQIIEETDQENNENETLYVPDKEKGLSGTCTGGAAINSSTTDNKIT